MNGGRVGNLVATHVGPDGGTGEVHVLATYVDEHEVDDHLHVLGGTYQDAAAFGREFSRVKPGIAVGGIVAHNFQDRTDEQQRSYLADLQRVKDALLRQLVAGTDVAEFLLDNRPGSLESGLFAPIIDEGT